MEKEKVIALIPLCVQGDAQAQEQLILAVQDRVYYHCRKMLRNEEDALDATQDILIAMLTKLDTLKEPGTFFGWLSGITANRCRNMLSREHRELPIPEDGEGNSLLDTYETLDEQAIPDKALDNDETRRMIVELVDALPPSQRMCVLMFYYDEMSVKDIAAALQTSEGTIKSRLNYARKAIKEGVDRYAAQGIKLYGLSPLPFLVYFLQKDAAASHMGAAAREAVCRGVLSGTAAAGHAGSGAGLTKGAKLISSVIGKKGAAAAAAVLAAVTAGVVLLPKETAPEPPPPVVEVVQPQPAPVVEPEPEPEPLPEPDPEPEPAPEPPPPEPEPPAEPDPQPEPPPPPEPEPEPEPEPVQPVVENQNISLQYGRGSTFGGTWDGGLPPNLGYSSSDPSVVSIIETGRFSTLSPGTAVLTAVSPEYPHLVYTITVEVRNEFAWSYTFADARVRVGGSNFHFITPYALYFGVTPVSGQWTSSDPSVVSIGQEDPTSCQLLGQSEGTAVITGVISFQVDTCVGSRTMTDTVSCTVTVVS